MSICVGFIYEAYDKILKKNVALKIEKKDKNKSILYFEYNVLMILKGKFAFDFNFAFRPKPRLQRVRLCEELRAELNCYGPLR